MEQTWGMGGSDHLYWVVRIENTEREHLVNPMQISGGRTSQSEGITIAKTPRR